MVLIRKTNLRKRFAPQRQRGSAFLLAVIFMVIMAGLAVALTHGNATGAAKSDAAMQSARARHAAQGGLEYVQSHLAGLDTGSSTGTALLNKVRDHLNTSMSGTLQRNNASLTVSNGVLTIPTLVVNSQNNDRFSAQLFIDANDSSVVRVMVTGDMDGVTRRVSSDLKHQSGSSSAIFGYGVATGGPVEMDGGVFIRRIGRTSNNFNDPEARLFTAYEGNQTTLKMSGSASIGGTAAALLPNAGFDFSGDPRVAGVGIWDDPWPNAGASLNAAFHRGVTGVEFPEIDTSVFEPYATDYRTSVIPYYDQGLGQYINTFDNVRILANSNPTIGNDTIIRGVLYIEAPNNVHITNGTQIHGVIVTEDAKGTNGTSKIRLSGGTRLHGVDSLPNDPKFAGLKQLKGSALLAPGFDLEMVAGFGTVGGTIAAESIYMEGGANATVKGTILAYGDGLFRMANGAYFYIDHTDLEENPAGFVSSSGSLDTLPGTYREYND